MWTDEDIEAALEWQAEQDLKCPGCGLPRDETMADEEHGPDYVAQSVQCRACEVRDIQARDQAAGNAGRPLNGVYHTVHEHHRRR